MTHDDDIQNLSANETIHDVLARVTSGVSRRNIIRGGVGLAAVPAMAFLPACGGSDEVLATTPVVKKSLTHTAVDKSTLDNVILPAGYTYTIVHATGDRLDSALPPYTNKGGEADDWSRRMGDHHDGMDIFYVDAAGKYSAKETSRAVLVMNHESSADAHFFNPRGQTSNGVSGKKFTQFGNWDLGTRPQDEAQKIGKELLCHVQGNESDRGTPGTAHLEWEGIRDALKEIGYDKAIVIETFGQPSRELAKAACIWRPLANSADELASEGLAFYQKMFR